MSYNIHMNRLKSICFAILCIVFFTALPAVSFAQVVNDGCDPAKKICNPIEATTIQGVILKFLEGALKIGIPIVALAIIYCGFLFVAAMGNSEKLQKAKDSLLYTLIGAGVLLGAYALAQLVNETVKALGS